MIAVRPVRPEEAAAAGDIVVAASREVATRPRGHAAAMRRPSWWPRARRGSGSLLLSLLAAITLVAACAVGSAAPPTAAPQAPSPSRWLDGWPLFDPGRVLWCRDAACETSGPVDPVTEGFLAAATAPSVTQGRLLDRVVDHSPGARPRSTDGTLDACDCDLRVFELVFADGGRAAVGVLRVGVGSPAVVAPGGVSFGFWWQLASPPPAVP